LFLVIVNGEYIYITTFNININDLDKYIFNYLKYYIESKVKEYIKFKVGILTIL
jgi:actin-like ATPase involved in cell morphogenesis